MEWNLFSVRVELQRLLVEAHEDPEHICTPMPSEAGCIPEGPTRSRLTDGPSGQDRGYAG
jgi:hypothetical protein